MDFILPIFLFVIHTLDYFDISECNLTSTTVEHPHIEFGNNANMTCNATEKALLLCGTNDVMWNAVMHEPSFYYDCSQSLNTTCQ